MILHLFILLSLICFYFLVLKPYLDDSIAKSDEMERLMQRAYEEHIQELREKNERKTNSVLERKASIRRTLRESSVGDSSKERIERILDKMEI